MVILDVDELLTCLKGKPAGVHIVITGRDADQKLIDLVDPGYGNAGNQTPVSRWRQGDRRDRILKVFIQKYKKINYLL
jgi:hypothetical protein